METSLGGRKKVATIKPIDHDLFAGCEFVCFFSRIVGFIGGKITMGGNRRIDNRLRVGVSWY